MIVVDSCVWIDYFRGSRTQAVAFFDALLAETNLLVPDLVLAEVLQGFSNDRQFALASEAMLAFPTVEIGGRKTALAAVGNFRSLRSRGVTIRSTIDTVIATWCIEYGHALLTSDRDFEPFFEHLGLRRVQVDV